MTEFDEIIRQNLENDWGPAAPHSEYKRGDRLRYRANGSTWRGEILWVAAQGPSRVEGHANLPLHYQGLTPA
jgi:hypothetical protein